VLRASGEHAIERDDFPLGASRPGDPSEQPSGHTGCDRDARPGSLRERERQLADDKFRAIDPGTRGLTAIPRGQDWHHGGEAKQ
jgi:hypothetical protein